MNPKLKYALRLSRDGYKVIPIYFVRDDKSCSCGNPKCQSIGKHPLEKGWQTSATTDEKVIKAWWTREPNANIGLVVPEDTIVIDIDPRNGGEESIDELEKTFGSLALTSEVKTGGGGRHLFYKRPEKMRSIKIKNTSILNGVDIKAIGGYVVSLGSNHISGGTYEDGILGFTRKRVVDLAHEEIIKLILNTSTNRPTVENATSNRERLLPLVAGQIESGSRNNFIFETASSLRARNIPPGNIFEILKNVNVKLCNPPLGESEVRAIAHGIQRYEPGFKVNSGPKFDIDGLIFDNNLGELIRAIHMQSEASPVATLTQMLAIISSVVGRKAIVVNGNINIPLNIYAMIVGSTGVGRKGTSYNLSKDVIKTLLNDEPFPLSQNGFGSGEALIKVLGEQSGNQGMVYYEPEAGKIFKVNKREGSTMSPVLRDAYDGSDLSVRTKKETLYASNYFLSFIGHITPHELTEEITTNDIENGLANRCLWIYSERENILPRGGEMFDLSKFSKLLEPLINMEKMSISIGSKAFPLWDEIYVTYTNRVRNLGRDGSIQARVTDYILKISALYALLSKSSTIEERHLNSALKLWDFSSETISLLFNQIRSKQGPNDKERLKLQIIQKGEITRTEVRDFFGRNKTKEEIDILERDLFREGLIKVETIGSTTKWKLKVETDKETLI